MVAVLEHHDLGQPAEPLLQQKRIPDMALVVVAGMEDQRGLLDLAEDLLTGPTFTFAAEAARAHDVCVHASLYQRADGPDEIARTMDAAWSLGLGSGVVVAHPIPEADEIPSAQMAPVIERALAELDERRIHGRDATPFLLGRIVELTGGASLTANIALVRENARVGAEIASAYAALL